MLLQLQALKVLVVASVWMSAVKKTYYCSQYNRTWKVGMGYVTAVYADRNWSDYIKTFTIRGF